MKLTDVPSGRSETSGSTSTFAEAKVLKKSDEIRQVRVNFVKNAIVFIAISPNKMNNIPLKSIRKPNLYITAKIENLYFGDVFSEERQ